MRGLILNEFHFCLCFYGKQYGFYQLTPIKVQTAAAAIRAAWATASNWRFWFDFLDSSSTNCPCLSMDSLHHFDCSPSFWDSPPFAVNLVQSFNANVFTSSLKLYNPTLPIVKSGR